jgi:hypothetical protein
MVVILGPTRRGQAAIAAFVEAAVGTLFNQ